MKNLMNVISLCLALGVIVLGSYIAFDLFTRDSSIYTGNNNMLWTLFTHSVVAIICWFFLPAPEFVQNIYDNWKGKDKK